MHKVGHNRSNGCHGNRPNQDVSSPEGSQRTQGNNPFARDSMEGCRAHKHHKHHKHHKNTGSHDATNFLQKITKMFPQLSGIVDQLKNLMPNSGNNTAAPPAATTPRATPVG